MSECFPGSHKLKKVQRVGNERWKALCPAHQDTYPSLSIRRGDRAWMYKCWSGCSIQAICEALDIKVSSLWFDNSKAPKPNNNFHKEMVFIYENQIDKTQRTEKDLQDYLVSKKKLSE